MMLKLEAIRKRLPTLCALAVAGAGSFVVAAPSKGSPLVTALPVSPIPVVKPAVVKVSPYAVVVSPAAAPASGVAPTKGSGSTTGLPAGGPPLGGISPPPLPPSAPVGP